MDTGMGHQGAPVLYMSIELSSKTWGLAFSGGEKIRQIKVPAGDKHGILQQVTWAKERLGLPIDAEL